MNGHKRLVIIGFPAGGYGVGVVDRDFDLVTDNLPKAVKYLEAQMRLWRDAQETETEEGTH